MSELGDILRSARQRKNVSLTEVASATRIKPAYLEALEDGDYAALPGPAYITGFLRNYAVYLGLHPDDVVQEYHTFQPPPPPVVKAATRVLASGHQQQNRTRILWSLSALVLLLAGGFAVRQYNDAYGHAYSAPLNVTAASIGASVARGPALPQPHRRVVQSIHLQLRATAPVWVRVTVDGRRAFQGILRARAGKQVWTAHHAIYVVTYDGAHLRARYDGRPMGAVASGPGLTVCAATLIGWKHIS